MRFGCLFAFGFSILFWILVLLTGLWYGLWTGLLVAIVLLCSGILVVVLTTRNGADNAKTHDGAD